MVAEVLRHFFFGGPVDVFVVVNFSFSSAGGDFSAASDVASFCG